jgi:uncharacterized membrane protein YphA (DoxX/SURF4 family)/peroxiredoxin
MKIFFNFARLLTGLVFIFSGFVKGVDPMGTAYRVEDYFLAWGMSWAEPLSLTLSVLLCAFEFTLGVYLLLNLKTRLTAWATLLLMAYFTILTFFDALYNTVPDCGCFGDALKLGNWETFYKNIVLSVFVILIFFNRNNFISPFGKKLSTILAVLIPLGFLSFSAYSLLHLPPLEFTSWKKGNVMMPDSIQPTQTYLVYKEKSTGATKEFLSKDLPWQDSVWMANWEYDTTRIVDPNVYPAPNFNIMDTSGTNLTMTYMQARGYVVFLVAVDLAKAKTKNLEKLEVFYKNATAAGYTVIGLTASIAGDISRYSKENGLTIPFYNTDDKELKTMIRSNPGIVLLKDARVLKKWHFRDIPSGEAFVRDYPVNP